MYHSTAILLPDGRVLSAGGDYQPSGEIYSPPYLFRGPRPVIQSAPTTMVYGSDLSLEFTPGGADGVLWVEPAGSGRIRVVFRNPDGSEAFCGNGCRCAARLAHERGWAPAHMTLLTRIGELPAEILEDSHA